jgi:uncharacterized protein (TIGR03083 family)
MDSSLYETGRPTLRGERVPNHVAYRAVRLAVTDLLAGRNAGPVVVRGCPEWTVEDLLGHLVGIAALAIGRISGWVPAATGGIDVPNLLSEWDRFGPRVEELIAGQGGRCGNLMVMDAFTHELDLRYTLGEELPAEHPAFARAFEVLANGFSASVTAHNLPGVRLSDGETQWLAGDSDPAATVTADRYALLRSLAGRRTERQITELDWDRDSHRWLPAFTWGPFTPPALPVE